MCDFKPGDDVVCVNATATEAGGWGGDVPVVWQVYRVEAVHVARQCPHLLLAGMVNAPRPENVNIGYRAIRFRKVQRLDLSAWLETAATDTDRWDKPIKASAPLHPVPSVDALFRRIMAGGDR